MDQFYRENILDHYKNPRNYGELDDPDVSQEEYNPLCGDQITLQIKFDERERVAAVRFHGQGCAISLASASMMTERLKGLSRDQIKALSKEDILDMMGIPISPVRMKCALLPLKAAKAGVCGLQTWMDLGVEDSW